MEQIPENTHISPQEATSLHESAPETPPLKTRKSTGIILIALLSLIVALACAAGMAYAWLQYQAVQAKTAEKIARLENVASKEQTALAEQRNLLNSTKQALQQLQTQVQQQAKPKDWLLSEVDYLVKLAALNLTVDNNVSLARKLLQAADQQLADSNNSAYWPVRQALADDISTLNTAPQVDLVGIIVRLNTLKQNIEKLPQVPKISNKPEQQPQINSTAVTTVSPTASWSDKAKEIALQVWESLKELVVIRQDGAQLAPLLPPDAFAFVVANIQAQLTMAQWAALHHQRMIYQQSLAQARSWIARYFAADSAQVKAAQGLLNNLLAIDISPASPDLSQSLQAIEKLLQPGSG